MNSLVVFIDAIAAGWKVESAASLANIDIKEASFLLSEHQGTIEQRRAEIEEKSKIILPSERWAILNQASDMGLNGYKVATKDGMFKLTYNPAISVSAVRVANEMAGNGMQTSDSRNITQVISEMFQDLTRDDSYSEEDAWNLIFEAMPDYTGVVRQLKMAYDGKKKSRG